MPQVTNESILSELDRLKRKPRPYLTPSSYKDHMPSAIPNAPDPIDSTLLKAQLDSIGSRSQGATKEMLIQQANKRDYEAMVEAERRLSESKAELKNTKRPVVRVPKGQPNFITQPYPVKTKPLVPKTSKGKRPPMSGNIKGWQDSTPGIGNVSTSNVATMSWRGRTLTLNPRAMDNFVGFLNALSATGYNITSLGSHAVRNIAGTNTPSLHSYGLAIDINPYANPVTYGAPVTNLPKGVGRLAAKYGLTWGGNWEGSKKDTMHFSIPYAGTK